MHLRRMIRADASALHDIHCACLTRTLAAHYTPEVIAAWREGRTPEGYLRAADDGEIFFVAESQGGVVGFASYRASELLALYVHPDMQGRGVGGALLARVKRDAVANGGAIARVKAARGAEAFYRRRGFVEIGSGATLKRGVPLAYVEFAAVAEAAPEGRRRAPR